MAGPRPESALISDALRKQGAVRACLLWAALTAALAFAAQFITAQFNYGGRWTGLFCTGSRFPIPPWLAHENIHVFADSYGYDGQFYHYIAHDPFMQHGTAQYLDGPRLRYRRILVPLLAWLLGGGRYVDAAYIAVILSFVFLGAYWVGRCSVEQGRHPAWGLTFLALPGTIASLDRMVLDGPLTALAAGFALYSNRGSLWKLVPVLVAAPLVRETGLLLIAASAGFELWRRRWRRCGFLACTALPALAWYAFVHAKTASPGALLVSVPLLGLIQRLSAPVSYPFGPPAATVAAVLDWLAIAGALTALALAAACVWKHRNPTAWSVGLFALLVTTLKVYFWLDIYGHSRIVSPLLALLVLGGTNLPWSSRWLPVALILPRVGMEVAWQGVGVLRAVLG